jgi:hypothetical protein
VYINGLIQMEAKVGGAKNASRNRKRMPKENGLKAIQ